jgi:hypothetical protein
MDEATLPTLNLRARSATSRLANLSCSGNSKKRRTKVQLARTAISESFTGYTTASHFTFETSGSKTLLKETKIPIPAAQPAPPVLSLPPVDPP